MSDIDEDWLGKLTWRELVDLQTSIHEAIRARIREKNALTAAGLASRASAPLPQVEASRRRSLAVREQLGVAVPATARPPATVQDQGPRDTDDTGSPLEAERDAWLARKRAPAQ